MNLIRVIESILLLLAMIAGYAMAHKIAGLQVDFTEVLLVSFVLLWVYRDGHQ